jgi:D-aspartate ligase
MGSGLTVLGVIRTLGRAGVPTYVVADARDFACRSIWYRPAPRSSAGALVERGMEAYLAGLPFERAVLMPCSDVWTAEVARLEPPLTDRFPSSLASACALQTFLDKAHFAHALDAAGIPHPRTTRVSQPSDLDSLPDDAFERGFLKPRDSQRFFRRFGVKAFRVEGRADAVAHVRDIAASGLEVVFQEYVPGPASHHVFVDGFVDRNGRVSATFARRRLRMYPVDFGNSTYQVSVARDSVAEAVATAERLMASVAYRGIFSCEFKYDERDSLYKILEVNSRPWWYVEFAARCGVDVCSMAYRDALGVPVALVDQYRVGRACVYPYYDFGACRAMRAAGRLTLRDCARSWLTAEQPVFRWADPLPALIATAEGVGRRLRKLVLPS